MLLDKDPASYIQDAVKEFNTESDKTAITRIHESLSTLTEARNCRVRDAEQTLRKLARTHQTLQAQHDELTGSTRSSTETASELAALDNDKFRVAKAVSDLEMEAERLASAQADLAARLAELEAQGLDGAAPPSDPVEDEVLLRLKVYRSLGIDIERDTKDGEFTKAVVRNDRKGDVHVVNMDKRFSRFFYANYFWQTL